MLEYGTFGLFGALFALNIGFALLASRQRWLEKRQKKKLEKLRKEREEKRAKLR